MSKSANPLHGTTFYVMLVAGNKVSFLEKSGGQRSWADWDDPTKKVYSKVLPTAIAEVGHLAPLHSAIFGEDGIRLYFGPVDTWKDLSLSIDVATAKMVEKGWSKSSVDTQFSQMLLTYEMELFT